MTGGRIHGYKTEAVVLRHFPIGEADRLFVLYTPNMGKVRAVARGVRRPKSKMSGHLQPLNRVAVSLTEGRDLVIITEAEAIAVYPSIRNDLTKLSAAMFLAELVDGFSEERSSSPSVYKLLTSALDLAEVTDNPIQLVRYILQMSGFGPELRQCVACDTPLEPQTHLFSSSQGGIICPNCRSESGHTLMPIPLNVLKVLRFFQQNHAEKALDLQLNAQLLGELERVLDGYTRFLLERDMKTAEFLDLVNPHRVKKAFSIADPT